MPTAQGALTPFRSATLEQGRTIVGAMRAVAASAGVAAAADERSITAAVVHVLGLDPVAIGRGLAPEPAALADALADPSLDRDALALIAVMAFVDGTLSREKIDRVLRYADALGVGDDYVLDLAQAAQEHVTWVVADMARGNAAGAPAARLDADFSEQFLPYDDHPEPELAAQFRALGALPVRSFGRAYYDHYARNGYAFPGEKGALSIAFAVPHDSAHLLSGYSTSAQGELLVATFAAAMHRRDGMAAHILPVIYSWHLGSAFNAVTGTTAGAFDGDKFRRAWERGRGMRVDTFGSEWNFWSKTDVPLQELRDVFGVPALDEALAAAGEPTAVRGWPDA